LKAKVKLEEGGLERGAVRAFPRGGRETWGWS